MRKYLTVATILAWAACAHAQLDHSKVGVYGTLFDFCDYSVFKFIYKDEADFAERLPRWRKMLGDAAAAGKPNLVLLYTFDRVKHSQPIEQYVRQTDAVLKALDLTQVHALCLSEENVTWNKGLDVLNALYDHIKAHYRVQVYQWLTMPDIPHPKLRADGWIIDPYGFDRVRFRRYLQKYLATGRPVIDCIWASPAHSKFSLDHTPPQQVEVCREFNVPMFFYCVDTKLGSPAVWLKSSDPDIVAPREWLMGVVRKAHEEGARDLPLESANFSDGKPIEVSGDEKGLFEFDEPFATEVFLDDATIRGFLGLTWDGQKETLTCDLTKAKLPAIELHYHFTSPFQISAVRAELRASHEGAGPPTTRLAVSENGQQWPDAAETAAVGQVSLTASPSRVSGREFWLRVAVTAPPGAKVGPAVLDHLRVTCRTALPERREVKLQPDAEGHVTYAEDFGSRKYLHLAELQGGETLTWQRGGLSTCGVQGRANVVELKWKFVSDKPLSDVRVVVEGAANGPNLGATNTVGLSVDGKTILVSDTTAGKETPPRAQGWFRQPLTLDAKGRPEFSGVREFHLHLTMTNTAAKPTGASNRLTKFTVSATAPR